MKHLGAHDYAANKQLFNFGWYDGDDVKSTPLSINPLYLSLSIYLDT